MMAQAQGGGGGGGAAAPAAAASDEELRSSCARRAWHRPAAAGGGSRFVFCGRLGDCNALVGHSLADDGAAKEDTRLARAVHPPPRRP